MSSLASRPTFRRRLAQIPDRIVELSQSWWRQATWPERVARLSVIAGLLLIAVLAFTAAGDERRPAALGVAIGAALLLLPAPWHWRSAGYVATLGFAIFFSNNAAQAADRPWVGWPLSLLVIALFALSAWMDRRNGKADAQAAHTGPTAQPAPPGTHDQLRR